MKTIVLQKNIYYPREILSIVSQCTLNNIPFIVIESSIGKKFEDEHVVVGSVEFVESALGHSFKPDYHPEWIKSMVKRKTWSCKKWPDGWNPCFIKPLDRYKLFDGTISTNWEHVNRKSKELFCQEIVSVYNEWRLYVINGEIKTHAQYFISEFDFSEKTVNFGNNKEVPLSDDFLSHVQSLIPSGWHGVIDLMETNYGLELCECHHPYAIGWYGDSSENKIYLDFIIQGYEYLKKQISKHE